MKLSSFLDSKFICVDFEASGNVEVIDKMIEKIAQKDENVFKMKKEIITAVRNRELEITTAVGNNILIPHARVENFDDILLAIAIVKTPYSVKNAMKQDDKIKIVFMIIAGQTKNKLLLKIMAAISKLIQINGKIDELCSKKNSDEIIEVIKNSEVEVSERLTAEDIVNTEIIPAKLEDSLEEIAKRFIIEKISGLPVVDKNGKFIGEITERELIEYGMPKYASLFSDLSFLTIGEPFEQYLKNEKTVHIEELYRKNPLVVDRKMPIMEVCFMMVTKGNTRIYVVENGHYYGMIARGDIINKILHI
jgi:nitrogen PTS system EIIA component